MSTVNQEKKAAPQDAAVQKKEVSSNKFEGQLVSLTGNKLVMTNREGKEYSHNLAKDARLTCHGTVCKAEDLKAGSKIRVTTTADDRNVATGIDVLDKSTETGQCCG